MPKFGKPDPRLCWKCHSPLARGRCPMGCPSGRPAPARSRRVDPADIGKYTSRLTWDDIAVDTIAAMQPPVVHVGAKL